MKYQIPTKQECDIIVKNNPDVFHKKEEFIDNYKAIIYNYRLANYQDFQIEGSLEMRGLTFIEDNGEYRRFIHLHKFFNYGEQAGFEGIQNSTIVKVQNKEDGSMIVPIQVDGKVYFKTRGTFFSEQALCAQNLYKHDKGLQEFIKNCYVQGYIPYFEFVSPWNQIVLQYPKTELRLIQARDIKSGEYHKITEFDISFFKKHHGVKTAKFEPSNKSFDLEYWQEKAKQLTGMEGWVITFKNGHMIKIKTDWYSALHHILTEGLTRENEMIEWVLNEKLDDVLAQVPENDIRRHYSLDIARFIRQYIIEKSEEIHNIISCELKPDYSNSRKKFAIKHREHPYFGVLMLLFPIWEDGEFGEKKYTKDLVLDFLKERILKNTNKWSKAQDWLKERGFKSEHRSDLREE